MDPLACFYAFHGAVVDGELDLAADAAESFDAFDEWVAKGGYKPELPDGSIVWRLDHEQDRFLVVDDGIERWRSCFRYSRVTP